MTKMLFALVGILAFSSAAFAIDFKCELLRDRTGHALFRGTDYTLEVDDQNIVLMVSSIPSTDEPVEYKMERIAQRPDRAVYEADGVKATVVISKDDMELPLFTISKKIGRKIYRARCLLDQSGPSGTN